MERSTYRRTLGHEFQPPNSRFGSNSLCPCKSVTQILNNPDFDKAFLVRKCSCAIRFGRCSLLGYSRRYRPSRPLVVQLVAVSGLTAKVPGRWSNGIACSFHNRRAISGLRRITYKNVGQPQLRDQQDLLRINLLDNLCIHPEDLMWLGVS
uniref:Uncharacterized protein n=1 Tax=Panagrellus redivivus TaxID=6233 RepID=A0A7E4ZT07_PANRE